MIRSSLKNLTNIIEFIEYLIWLTLYEIPNLNISETPV
jgi:hypothetical protein